MPNNEDPKITQFKKDLRHFLEFQANNIITIETLPYCFEISCYGNVLRYYSMEFDLEVTNLEENGRIFKYKATTTGNPNNFSFFLLKLKNSANSPIYEIRSNVAVQSYYNQGTFIPDITVLNNLNYNHKVIFHSTFDDRTFCFQNSELITFFEVKHMRPGPIMCANFVGTVKELMPRLILNSENPPGHHPAPTLFSNGMSSENINQIVNGDNGFLERYSINFIFANSDNSPSLTDIQKRINTQT